MKKVKTELLEWIKSLVFALIVVTIIQLFIAPTMVYSVSMKPTLVEKDVVILNKIDDIQRGDIISFKSEMKLSKNDIKKLNPIQQIIANRNLRKNLIKRVIGLPGDSILIEDSKVIVNGVLISEDYLGSKTIGNVYIDEIPSGEYFVMGDNRSHSMDSRDIGTISSEKIIGKSVLRIYPLNKIGVVD
jgi:signal peptidase I